MGRPNWTPVRPRLGRVRHPGGGRKKAAELDSGLRPALLALVEPDERGESMSPLRWTTKPTRKLAAELTRQGRRVSADTVAGLLREEGFSLQANAKTIEGAQHPDREAQFRYLNEQARDHRDAGDPVISVDSKKKELIGDYRNAGHEWQPAGQPVRVKTHDFLGQAEKAIPYGIYGMTANTGWVSIEGVFRAMDADRIGPQRQAIVHHGAHGFLVCPALQGEAVNHGEPLRDGGARAVAVDALTLSRRPSAS